jgi:putative ABC transport system permease protein
MTILGIVHKNLRKRLLSTVLTIGSIVLGVALITAILVIQAETERSYNQTSVGYDLIFAAKGSQLQTTLNTLYHLETSTGIIPFSLYEAAKADPRVSYAFPMYVGDNYNGYRVIGTSAEFIDQAEPRRGRGFEMAQGRNFEAPLEAVLGAETARRTGLRIGDTIVINHGLQEVAEGAEAHEHDNAPVTIVGILKPTATANDRVIFTDLYTTHALHDPTFHLDDHDHAGHSSADSTNNHDDHDHDHHDHHDHAHDDHDHDHDDHAHAHDDHDHAHDDHAHDHSSTRVDLREIITLKELDAVLVKMESPAAALQVAGLINFPTPANPLLARNMMRDPYFRYKDQIMAVVPATQIMALMSIVGNAEKVLRFVAVFVVIVALFSVLIAIYNTMEERKRDLAVMRALGARRFTIFSIIILESAVITATGAIIGMLGGHLIVSVASSYLADVAGIVVQAFIFDIEQFNIVILLLLSGILIGIIPAFKAYQTDPVRNLGSGK